MCAKISAGSISDNRTNFISDLIAASFDVLVAHCPLDAIFQQSTLCLVSRWDIRIQFVAIQIPELPSVETMISAWAGGPLICSAKFEALGVKRIDGFSVGHFQSDHHPVSNACRRPIEWTSKA